MQVRRPGDVEKLFIGAYKARYFDYVNAIGVVLQLFFVSRVIKYLGMRAALLAMPLASMLGHRQPSRIRFSAFCFAHAWREQPRLLYYQRQKELPTE